MKQIAALADVHYIMIAPHDGSLGPVAQMTAVQLLTTLPNILFLEYLMCDATQR